MNIAAILFFSPEQAAASLRDELSAGNGPLDVLAMANALGCRVRSGGISPTKTVQADLYPDPRHDLFHLQVDPEPAEGWGEAAPSQRWATARHRLRFRVGHELGHTFFYERRKGQGPRRAWRWSSAEEEWCDEFARWLLVPASAARSLSATADSVFRLQRRFDISLEVAARALAGAHPETTVAVWFWPQGSAKSHESLLRQWASCEVPSLRHWRASPLVATALTEGEADGSLVALSRPARRLGATARCERLRRQVVVVAG
jgi:IrrE N-terminal-like domain